MRKVNSMLVIVIVLVLLSFCGHAFAGKSGKPIAPGSTSAINGQNEQQVCLNMLHGTLVRTDNPLDLAIEGEGYIVLNNGQQDLYSRGRSIAVDKDCYLVDPYTGYCVQRIGSAGEDDGFQSVGDSSIRIPFDETLPGSATSMIRVQGNLGADQTFSQTQVLGSNITYTFNGYTAPPHIKIADLDQFSGTPSDGRIYVDIIEPDGTEVTDSTGLIVSVATTLENLLSYIDNKFGAGNATASLAHGEIWITDDNSGYSRTDILLSYAPGGNETLVTPAYFKVISVGGEQVRKITIIFYDSQGDTHVLNAAFVRTDMPNTWDLLLTSIDSRSSFKPGGVIIPTIPINIQKSDHAFFSPIDPKIQPIRDGLVNIIIPPELKPIPVPIPIIPIPALPEPANIHEITFDGRRIEGIEFSFDGSYAGLNAAIGDTAEFAITFKHDTSNPQAITIDMGPPGQFNGLTQFFGNSTAVAKEQDGYGSGDLLSVSVKNDGTIVGTFSNGAKRDIATIQMAMFDNVCGLESIGDGYFLGSDESGEAIATQATFNDAGLIYGKYLEEPVEPVDFAREKIWRATNNKKTVLWVFDLALDKEWLASAALEIMLESGDFGDLKKRDIIKAKRKVDSAIRLEKLSKKVLQISVKELEHALSALGVEPDGN